MDYKKMFLLLARYLFLGVLAIFNLSLFYHIFTPLTIYPVSFILGLFYESTVLFSGTNSIFLSGVYINIISACIAGSAYYFLLILNLTTPMPLKTRIKSILFLFISFLFINIMRIVIFASLFVSGYKYFDITHKFIWYLGSTVLVVGLWFLNVWIFKIRSIPIFSDVKDITEDIIQTQKT